MKKLDYKLPDELCTLLNSLEYEEEGGIVIRNVKRNKDDLTVTVDVMCGPFLNLPVQIWDINILNIDKHQITINWSNNFHFYSEHFLLMEYQDDHAELYFNGKSNKAKEIFVEIYEALTKAGGTATEIANYVFTPQRLDILCKQEYGLFARGPKSILSIYENALIRYGIKTNYISQSQPSLESKENKLLMIGESYFVGKNFNFKRVN